MNGLIAIGVGVELRAAASYFVGSFVFSIGALFAAMTLFRMVLV